MGDKLRSPAKVWWSVRLRSVIASVATAALLENVRVDWLAVNNLGKTAFSIHVVIYILRTLPWLIFARVFGLPDRSSYLSLSDAMLVRILNFSSRAPSVTATRPLLKLATHLLMAAAARRFPRARMRKMHFGLSRAPHEALCITLDYERSLSDCVVVMAFHGGGYSTGECEMYTSFYIHLLRLLEDRGVAAAVLSVEYPLAPEHPYPAAIDFAENLYRELVERRGVANARKVILLGDSAGGALCFALSLRLAAAAADASREQLQVAGLVAICPWVTHEFETPSMREMHGQDYLHAGVIRNASRMYVGSGTHHMHPEVSVSTHPNVHLLPPCLMLYGDREMFASSIVSFAQTLKAKACHVELVVGKDMPHVYPSLWPRFQPESTRALERIADFCAERVCVERT